jgi:hypothetical protein
MTEPAPIRLRLDRNNPGPAIPSALEAYRALRADGGEAGKRIKDVLERLRDDPGKVRGSCLRYRNASRRQLADGLDVPTPRRDRSQLVAALLLPEDHARNRTRAASRGSWKFRFKTDAPAPASPGTL